MNLFIIGNGFDKAHLLKTDYIDFRDFLYGNYPDFLSLFEEAYGNCLESSRELVNNFLWKNFEENLCNIVEDYIVENATSIDLDLEGGDVGIEDTMNAHWDEQYSYIKRLREYLGEWVNSINIDVPAKTNYIQARCNKGGNVTEDMFLTFNYTLLLENVYKINPRNICHIHGSIADKKNELVIGHGNKEKQVQVKMKRQQAQEEFNDKASSIYSVLASYYDQTEKDVNFYIKNNRSFFRSLRNVDKIYIVGHSLGEVDLPYFEVINRTVGATTKWTIICCNNAELAEKKAVLKNIGIADKCISGISATNFFNQ